MINFKILLHTNNMKKFIDKYNLLLFIPLVIIMIGSFFCMYQSIFIKDIYKYHLIKQILWYFIGFMILIIIRKIKLKFFFRYSFIFYFINLILLLLVLFFGSDINGAKAWFNFKIFNFQPSEFMKFSLTLYLSKITEDFSINKQEFKYIIKCLIVTLIPCILVFLEPDTGAILFYLLILLATYLLSGIKKRWFIISFILIFIISSSFVYLYLFNQDLLIKYLGTSIFYRVDRLIHFKDGMQINNALITIGNANILGNFISNSLLYVPEFPTDFVFTLLISIFGFIGGLILIICLFMITYYLINVLVRINNISFKVFIHSFLYLFLFQQIENIFMNLSLLPIMGIPLPFLSYGGSNMIVYFIFLGFILQMKKD